VLSLHSGEFADEEALLAMKRNGTVLVPTIAWLHARTLSSYPYSKDPTFLVEATDAYVACAQAIQAARELGVLVALGTDACHRFAHAPDVVVEMMFLQALGYSAIETLRASTSVAAQAIGRSDSLGSLAPGMRGDILVVDGSPCEDVAVLRDKDRIDYLFVDGVVQHRSSTGVIGEAVDVGAWVRAAGVLQGA
jgi:imidazolonepropionase-like amidohydrolase